MTASRGGGPVPSAALLAALAVTAFLLLPAASLELTPHGTAELAASVPAHLHGVSGAAPHTLDGTPLAARPATFAQIAAPQPLAAPSAGLWADLTTAVGTAPIGREDAAFAYDPAANYDLLFGGLTSGGGWDNDTWTFHNGTWTKLTSLAESSPPPTEAAAATYDPAEIGVLVFGGTVKTGMNPFVSNLTWLFHGGTWSNLTSALPRAPPRLTGASMAYDSADGYVVLFGGNTATGHATNYTWSFANGSWKNITATAGIAPPPSCCSTLVDDPTLSGLLLSTAADEKTSNTMPSVTWKFAGGHWSSIATATSPPASLFSAGAFDPRLNATVDFGGSTGSTTALNQTWEEASGGWSNETNVNLTHPAAREGPAITYDPWERGVLLFGGYTPATQLDQADTWVYSAQATPSVAATANHTITEVTVPVLFTAVPGGNGTPPYTYAWTFGDNGTGNQASVSHWYGTVGNFTAQVTITDVTGHSSMSPRLTIRVETRPAAVTPAERLTVTEVGVADTFNATAAGGTPPYSFVWSFGNGARATGQQVTYTYNVAGPYTITVTAVDSLGGTVQNYMLVTVNGRLACSSAATPTPDDALVPVLFSPHVAYGVGPFTYLWTFGDGNISLLASPSHSYARGGSYSVLLTVTDSLGITSSSSTIITVHPPLSVSATSNVSTTDMQTPVQFGAAASNGTAPFLYNWNFGDGTIATVANPVHTFVGPGTFYVQWSVTDGVGVVVPGTIHVLVHPLPSVHATASSQGIAQGDTVNFSASAVGGTGLFNYAWTFGDGGIATGPSVSHTYQSGGTFSVVVTVVDEVGQSAQSAPLSVHVQPTTPVGGGGGGSSPAATSVWLYVGAAGAVAGVIALGLILRRRGKSRSPQREPAAPQELSTDPPSGPESDVPPVADETTTGPG